MRTKKISPGLRAVVAVLAMTFVMSTWAAAQITVLHSFGNGNDGTDPADSLIFDGAGNLYGMTGGGGAKSEGTVFELKAPASPNGAWKYSVLHSFPANSTDGKFPNAGLTYDPSSGNLYGTAASGGAFGFGMVFEFTPVSGGNWKYNPHHVYDFANVATGEYPSQTLTVDKAGNLYGVTNGGGGGAQNDEGVAFELSPPTTAGGKWTETWSHPFGNGLDGATPYSGLVFDPAGINLYGTTASGGQFSEGTVYELSPLAGGGWGEQVVYSFGTNAGDGATPLAGVVFDGSGNLYGTTYAGGAYGGGTVFELSPPTTPGEWTEQVLASLDGTNCCLERSAGVIFDASLTNLYGATSGGGPSGYGTVFELSPPTTAGGTWTYTQVLSFGARPNGSNDGDDPAASLTLGPNGALFGTTYYGGSVGSGAAFEIAAGFSSAPPTFKTQLDYTPSAPKTITLDNPFGTPMTGITASFTGTNAADFSITGGTCGSTLAGFSSCTYLVVFTPSLAGVETGTLNITDSAGTQVTALKGTGSDALLTASSKSFGKVPEGSTGQITVTKANANTAATLTYTSIALDGGGTIYTADPSSTCSTTGGSIGPGSSCTVVVDFTPTATGSTSVIVDFTDNATGTVTPPAQQTVTLTGTGIT